MNGKLDTYTALGGLKSNLMQLDYASDVSPKGLEPNLSCNVPVI